MCDRGGVDTRERLIESTREPLWERGRTGTGPRAVQQRAGAGQGSMYHHFSGKPDLALAAIERSAEELRDRAEAEFSAPAPPCSGSPPTCSGSATPSRAAPSAG
ncbi:TetR/AcrR family transcriptional regulator [Nocardiopsis sp. CNT-189]|uniref:TetR/AcrR family transcriptional regulator n=1 Tax=Nocardiopsis oceanisediminis TaxID=2816862 RepID=UPI003B3AD37E